MLDISINLDHSHLWGPTIVHYTQQITLIGLFYNVWGFYLEGV